MTIAGKAIRALFKALKDIFTIKVEVTIEVPPDKVEKVLKTVSEEE